MGNITWSRVVLCGVITGLIYTLLSMVILTFLGAELATAAPKTATPSRGLLLYSFAVSLAMGVWAMWLYAAIRPRFGPGPRTAVIAGCAWWVMYCLSKANWGPYGLVSTKALMVMMLAFLPSLIAATLAGARFYEEKPLQR
ncbi:MAG TPA: hypothetical protein VM056_04225 [Terriglobales bacterium]|nr:hypothetical protein [Terriglobales bacterium]